jgi:serine/threonine protein phosphatase 1
VIPARLPPGVRVYAVGDVHGRLDLLVDMLARIEADIAARPGPLPLRVFLGDYIDRGPDSARVIEALIDLQARAPTVCLCGNHETYALRFLMDASSLSVWSRVGAADTITSYGLTYPFRSGPRESEELRQAFVQRLPPLHRRFLESLPLTLTLGDYLFVHAGVVPGVPLCDQRRDDLIMIREPFLSFEGHFGKVVVHGHTPVETPEVRPNRINLDTGAFRWGRLTCAVFEADTLRFL